MIYHLGLWCFFKTGKYTAISIELKKCNVLISRIFIYHSDCRIFFWDFKKLEKEIHELLHILSEHLRNLKASLQKAKIYAKTLAIFWKVNKLGWKIHKLNTTRTQLDFANPQDKRHVRSNISQKFYPVDCFQLNDMSMKVKRGFVMILSYDKLYHSESTKMCEVFYQICQYVSSSMLYWN